MLGKKLLIQIPIVILFIVVTIILITKELNYGPYFDDVYRINNLFPLLNSNALPYENQSISSISIFGTNIPLMYKTYISSTSILPFTPIGLFENSFLGLQIIKGFYFLMAMLIIFLITSRYSLTNAALLGLMIVSSPVFFHKLVTPVHLILIPIAVLLIYQHFKKNNGNLFLFLGIFLMALSINIKFYSLWMVASLLTTSLIFFPKKWLETIKSIKKILIIVAGIILGIPNYIIYNIKNPFASLMPLYNKLFNTENYTAIDYKTTKPLLTEIYDKFDAIAGFLGITLTNTTSFYIAIHAFILLLLIAALYKIIKLRKFKKYKYYFFPIANFILIFIFILITPNATRAQHYTFLTPFYELSILFSVILFYKEYQPPGIGKKFKYLVPLMVIVFNISLSGAKTITAPPPDKYHTKQIYALNDYINGNKIDSENILHTEWGMYSQLYFLNRGEYRIKNIAYEILNKKTYQEKYEVIEKKLAEIIDLGNTTLYLPIYNLNEETNQELKTGADDLPKSLKIKFAKNNQDILKALDESMKNLGIKNKSIETKEFYDNQTGKKVITLYNLKNLDKLMIDEIKKLQDTKSYVDFTESDYKYTKGLCEYEETFRWSQQKSTIYLKYNNEKYLSIQIYIPDINNYPKSHPQFTVKIDGQEIHARTINSSETTLMNIELPKNLKINKKYLTVELNMDQSINSNNEDQRELSFILSQIGFTNEKVMLDS